MLKVTIDRAKWGSGYLLDCNDKMCALGWVGHTLGIDKESMLNIRSPFESANHTLASRPLWGESGLLTCQGDKGVVNSIAASNIMEVNDSSILHAKQGNITWEHAEANLIRECLHSDIEITFVGERDAT